MLIYNVLECTSYDRLSNIERYFEVQNHPEAMTDKQVGSRARVTVRNVLKHENAVLGIILAVLVIVMAVLTRGKTISRQNATTILLQSSSRGLASIGQLFIILTGNIDLSIGGLGLMCMILAGRLITTQPGLSLLSEPVGIGFAIPIMFLVGLGIGAVNGVAVSRLFMPSLIVTLAMWEITKGAGYIVSGGGLTLRLFPRSLAFFGQGVIGGVPVPIIMFVSAAVVAYFVLNYTTFGRQVYAVGGNPVSAWLSGIKVQNIQLAVFVVSGFMAPFAALTILARTMSAGVGCVLNFELDSIAAVCVGGVSLMGGRGTLIGAMIGVLIFGVINNGLNIFEVPPAMQEIVRGVIIFVAVAVDYWRRRR